MKHTITILMKAAGPAQAGDGRFILSAATPDRVGDTIDPAAYRSAASKKKLVALFNHDANKIVGFWDKLAAESDYLAADLNLASTDLGNMVRQLKKDGVPLAVSIGFRGAGMPNKFGGLHFTKLDLMEASIVATPAHPRAQQIAKSFGFELPVLSDASVFKDDGAQLSAARALGKSIATLTGGFTR